MKVALKVRSLLNKTGIGRYTAKLMEALACHAGIEVGLFSSKLPAEVVEVLPHGSDARIRNWDSHALWEQLQLPRDLWAWRPDIYHNPDFTLPLYYRGPSVVTVHDITYKLLPQAAGTRAKWYYGALMPHALQHASGIITVSEHSKRDLVRHCGVHPDRIWVTPLAADPPVHAMTPPEIAEWLEPRDLKAGNYLLYVGSLGAQKNVSLLVRAFHTIVQNGSWDGDLVLVGRRTTGHQEIVDLVTHLGIESRVKFLGYLSDMELDALYAGCFAFVFPSLYEGFGLPPLEAMMRGAPVVCSNAASLPEVVGDAAVLFDPTNLGQLIQALTGLLGNPQLARKLAVQGRNRASQFSWQKTASMTVDVYRDILKQARERR